MKSTPKTKKKFDCVESKRQAQERIYEETKGMSHQEEIAYFEHNAMSGPFGNLWRQIRQKAGKDAASDPAR